MKFCTLTPQDILVLPSAVASCCYKSCKNDSPENYGFLFVMPLLERYLAHSDVTLYGLSFSFSQDCVKLH
jgi:hypothetical protein